MLYVRAKVQDNSRLLFEMVKVYDVNYDNSM